MENRIADIDCEGTMTGTLTLTNVVNASKITHAPVSATLFAVDEGPNLDTYLFGDQLPNGALTLL